MPNLITLLQSHQSSFKPVVPAELQHGKALVIDFHNLNQTWDTVNFHSVSAMQSHTQKLMQQQDAVVAVGGYGEERSMVYQRELFAAKDDAENRCIHLGIDLTVPASTPVFAPLAGIVDTVTIRAKDGDYGGLVILKHRLEGEYFYTLYGHLSWNVISHLQRNQKIQAGQQFAVTGDIHENGNWPPHLHIQIVRDLLHYQNDFPGVVKKSEAKLFLQLCPDPNLLLNISALNEHAR